MEQINTSFDISWTRTRDALPGKSGWFLITLVPSDYIDAGVEGSIDWMRSFGISKGWFNDSTKRFFDHYGTASHDVTHRVIAWASMPKIEIFPNIEDMVKSHVESTRNENVFPSPPNPRFFESSGTRKIRLEIRVKSTSEQSLEHAINCMGEYIGFNRVSIDKEKDKGDHVAVLTFGHDVYNFNDMGREFMESEYRSRGILASLHGSGSCEILSMTLEIVK